MAGAAPKPQPPQRFWRLLKSGDTWNEYHGDPVRLIGAIVGMAVENGIALPWLERLLQNPANAVAEHVRNGRNIHGRVKLADVRRWYERSSSEPRRAWHGDADREAWRAQLVELRQLATSSPWPARVEHRERDDQRPARVKGSDLRRVFAAHLQLALAAPGIDYPASRRKVAELANVGDNTGQRATAVLVALGILNRRRPPGTVGAFSAMHYRVQASGAALCAILATDHANAELAELAALETHPLWRHGSGVRFDVWANVVADDGRATVASIADAAGCTRHTVRRVLRNLAALELVEQLDDHTYRATTTDRAALDAAALDTGMADRARRQLERHDADRAAHVERVLRTPRLFVEAMRRRVRAVVDAMRDRLMVNVETGEVVTVSVERERPPREATATSHRQNAPPSTVVAA